MPDDHPRTFSLGPIEPNSIEPMALARVIGPVLKRLYPQNPDIVLGREAMHIAEALIAAGVTVHIEGPADG